MRSRPGRSTARSTERRARELRAPDVFLFPAVVGGGLGDIEETLAAGRVLANAGCPVFLFRPADRAMPRDVKGPWDWPARLRRVTRLPPLGPAALTVAPAWGVSAAPAQPGALGRPGPWADEARAVEQAYGVGSTLHVSLEEFARTLSVERENRERFREGGVAARALPGRLHASRRAGELDRFRAAFERFRAFDRENVLHLFATFRRDAGFAREFPAAVQTGPLWPHRHRPAPESFPPVGVRHVVWYASPASAERVAPGVVHGLSEASVPVRLLIRTPRPWRAMPFPPWVHVADRPIPARRWALEFRSADLRIVTGSRTLLEALEVGGPFLYFNGVLGEGRRTRRHRPEKLVALLAARRGRLAVDLRRDLADFARARRVHSVVHRAADRVGGWSRFPRRWVEAGFRPPFNDAGALIVGVARALATAPEDAAGIVARVRAGSNP